MATFFTCPSEIQLKIIGYLNYANLTRLRMACRYMRDLPSHQVRKRALRMLEDEFIDGRKKAHWARLHDDNPELYKQAWEKHTKRAGYRPLEVAKLDFTAPCYTCTEIVPRRNFDIDRKQNSPYALKVYSEVVWGDVDHIMPIRVFETDQRQCIECWKLTVDSDSATSRERWTRALGYRVVLCSDCGDWKHCMPDIDSAHWKQDKPFVNQRQLNAAKCDDCWASEDEKWRETRNRLKALIQDSQYYLDWMRSMETADRYDHGERQQPSRYYRESLGIQRWGFTEPFGVDEEDDSHDEADTKSNDENHGENEEGCDMEDDNLNNPTPTVSTRAVEKTSRTQTNVWERRVRPSKWTTSWRKRVRKILGIRN